MLSSPRRIASFTLAGCIILLSACDTQKSSSTTEHIAAQAHPAARARSGTKQAPSAATGGYRDEARQLLRQGKEREAFTVMEKAADAGDAEMQYLVGQTYYWGDGPVARQIDTALRWMRKAAEQGHIEAQFNLSVALTNGEGIAPDQQEALVWLKKSAEQGLPAAQYNLAEYYFQGLGVTQDYQEARNWYLKAAEQGESRAQCMMGMLYRDGLGIVQDMQTAARWFEKAAAAGDSYAQYYLGQLYADGQGVRQNEGSALGWIREAARQGNHLAESWLARHARQHHVAREMFPVDHAIQLLAQEQYDKAIPMLTDMAEKGVARAQSVLGFAYMEGVGVEKDPISGFRWLMRAAQQNFAYAQYQLGIAYLKGNGVNPNRKSAREWLARAAEQGNLPAQLAVSALDKGEDEKAMNPPGDLIPDGQESMTG
ncbi:MAG: SEL1-like repeat protein [Burkholderiaceae bacterium]|nr:SEL1-like repeat protein [Burkholderiaceae bacterium]